MIKRSKKTLNKSRVTLYTDVVEPCSYDFSLGRISFSLGLMQPRPVHPQGIVCFILLCGADLSAVLITEGVVVVVDIFSFSGLLEILSHFPHVQEEDEEKE